MPDASPSVPVSLAVPHARPPVRTSFTGRFVQAEPLDPVLHLADLHAAAAEPRLWDWLGYGSFADEAAMQAWLEERAHSTDPLFMALRDLADERAKGMCAWLRLEPAMGVIEIGHIWFGMSLQRTPAATEAMYLLFRHAFDERGYRRLEWKCDSGNLKSRNAALRLGFAFEGIFRQHMIVKGRNRDTAWFSLLDHEWPAVRRAMESWLAPANFDGEGRQRSPLAQLIEAGPQQARHSRQRRPCSLAPCQRRLRSATLPGAGGESPMRHPIAQSGLLLGLIALVAATAAAQPESRPLSLDELRGIAFRHADPPPAPLPPPPIAIERAVTGPPVASPEPRPEMVSPATAGLTSGDLGAVAFRPPAATAAPAQAEAGTPLRLDLEALGALGISRSN